MENRLIEQLSEDLRLAVPDVNISMVKSYVGENFWSFEIGNSSIRGSGASLDPTLAFQKAISEFVERDAVRIHAHALKTKTSSGFASHITLADANICAKSELIERDILLLCWFADIRPCWAPLTSIKFSRRLTGCLEFLESIGITLKMGILGKGSADYVAVGILNLQTFSNGNACWALSTESDVNLLNAMEKTALSLLRIANLIITRKSNGIRLFNKIATDEISKPEHHLEYHLDPQNKALLAGWWESKNTEFIEVPTCKVECVEVNTQLARQLNRFVAFAHSDQLIPYFAGLPKINEKIDARLSDLGLKRNRQFAEIHPLP